MKARLFKFLIMLYRAFGSPANGTIAVVVIASLLWLIAFASLKK
jgi:hypothetical protein